MTLAVVYGLGLTCHGIQRVLSRAVGKPSGSDASTPSWYSGLARERRNELATYFWYMRATTWNLAIAMPIAFIVAGPLSWPWPARVICAFFPTAILFFLGRDFDWSMRNAVSVSEPETPLLTTAEIQRTTGELVRASSDMAEAAVKVTEAAAAIVEQPTGENRSN